MYCIATLISLNFGFPGRISCSVNLSTNLQYLGHNQNNMGYYQHNIDVPENVLWIDNANFRIWPFYNFYYPYFLF